MGTSITDYIKNIGKSIEYAAIDQFKENNKTATGFIETNQ